MSAFPLPNWTHLKEISSVEHYDMIFPIPDFITNPFDPCYASVAFPGCPVLVSAGRAADGDLVKSRMQIVRVDHCQVQSGANGSTEKDEENGGNDGATAAADGELAHFDGHFERVLCV